MQPSTIVGPVPAPSNQCAPSDQGSARENCRLALAISASAFDVSAEDIRAPARRGAGVAAARHVAIYLSHVVFQVPMQGVADAFGRERTSVGHAVRRVEDRRDEPAFDRLMERLEGVASFCARRSDAWGDGR